LSKKKQVHVHGDLHHAGKRGDELKVVAAAATQKVTAGVFQQVQLLHLLIDDFVHNSKISAISGA
jgi:hypothetical protein